MRDLSVVVSLLKAVRDAERRFARMARLEEILVGTEMLDRLAADLANLHPTSVSAGHGAPSPAPPGR